ncbi:DUF3817 domain-containing protein [Paenibacillus sp. 481]|uniref:DUF3817 domain-containing protein n=1 Tax=Paenibacillus sp. 481 TaxID=2835869 RepID=UPI001E4D7DE2|nr:DUF3817 domain-containing protein [Paenibacillus sp. 481]UHA72208.1 DUF3817 domain-containing protein [Paenibacillus sp. 481]
MLSTPIGRLRVVGIIEGISYLVLLLIAMPLKYWADFPQAVKVAGMAHGVLFCLYVAAVAHVMFAHRWPIGRAIVAIVASLVPIGNFWFDRQLKQEQQHRS